MTNGEAVACSAAITPNGRCAYTAKAGTSSVSSYRIDDQAALSLLAQKAAVMPAGNGALDMATTPDGRQQHVFASRAPQQIVSYRIGGDRSLTPLGAVDGITAGSAGLAANRPISLVVGPGRRQTRSAGKLAEPLIAIVESIALVPGRRCRAVPTAGVARRSVENCGSADESAWHLFDTSIRAREVPVPAKPH